MSRRAPARGIITAVFAGALGCGGGQLDGQSAAGPEGIPAGLVLPIASGSCELGYPPLRLVQTASWDAGTSTFTLGTLYWRLDSRGKIVEHGQTDGQSRELATLDEHGVMTAFTYEWQGGQSAENSWDQHNDYDAAGRLTASELIYRSGLRHTLNEYQYTGEHLTRITSHHESSGTTWDSWTQFFWLGDQLAARERGSGSTKNGRDTRFYDGSGRLVRIDIDGAGLGPSVDGTPDLRRLWAYDAAGRVARYQEDGTEILDAPFVDGIIDGETTFDPACAQIAVLPHALYQMPSWLQQR